jgi:hypothetical protein
LVDVTCDRDGRQEMREKSGQTFAPALEADGRILADFDADPLAVFWKQFAPDEHN